ncbi:MAG: copper amine oxidase N-terminal domain-containing protein [Paludibacter sp.]|nr:copper amine oxidase N-terminal domain-containing protein [Paludibacter sp.]
MSHRLQKNQHQTMEAKVNDKVMMLDVPATIIDGRTVVPVRFVAEATGADVEWDGSTRTLVIDTKIENINTFSGNVENVEIKSVGSNIFSQGVQ